MPQLEALSSALANGLGDTYRDVRVGVKPCPDLRVIGCVWPGLGGASCIVDVGGEPYAHNPLFRHVLFEIPQLQRCIKRTSGKILGAGMAWPAAIGGHCGEVIANLDTSLAISNCCNAATATSFSLVNVFRRVEFYGLDD